jgi:hypothetical protein
LDDEEDFFEILVHVIRAKAPEASTQSKTRFEWRLVLLVALIEFFVFSGCLWTRLSFEKTVTAVIFGGIVGSLAGMLWERQARKK